MRRLQAWMVVVCLATLVAACGGSGGRSTEPPGPPGPTGPTGPTGPKETTGLANPDAGTYYDDVFAWDQAANTRTSVPFGQWPSWLHAMELVPACAKGKVFHADRCWDRLTIDVDARAVTFANAGGETTTVAMEHPLPADLGTGTSYDPNVDAWVIWSPQKWSKSFVDCQLMGPNYGYDTDGLWGGLPTGLVHTPRTPWALGCTLGLWEGTPGHLTTDNFIVKTTLLYGFRGIGQYPELNDDFQIVSNWSYTGSVRIQGHDLPLPLHLADVTAVTGVKPRGDNGATLIWLDVNSYPQVTIASDTNLLALRKKYGGAGEGLTDDGLVTSIEFTGGWLLDPP